MNNFTCPINFSNGSHCTQSRSSVFHSNWRPHMITPHPPSSSPATFPLGPSTSAHWPPRCTYCLFPVPGVPSPESPVAPSCLSSGLCLRVPLLAKLYRTTLCKLAIPAPHSHSLSDEVSHGSQRLWNHVPGALPCSWGLWIGNGAGPSHLYYKALQWLR